jgi:lysophospholipase L1-like esterase
MLKRVHIFRRVPLSLVFAIAVLFALGPVTLASSNNPGTPLHQSGPKQHYLALGDSLAFGFQPNGDFTHGYVNDLFQILQSEGSKEVTNLGCSGETSTTFIEGSCPGSPSNPAQLASAVEFLQAHPGEVGPITLDIGANDVLHDINPITCTVDIGQFNADLATLDSNLTRTILPALRKALKGDGPVRGSIVMMNYYDPYQNICPETVPFIQTLNRHLAHDVKGVGSIIDVFDAFGGATTPNPNICTFTWMCTSPPDIHATNDGYSVIADTFAAAILQD